MYQKSQLIVRARATRTGDKFITQIYRVVQKKWGHSTFSQISRKLLKINK